MQNSFFKVTSAIGLTNYLFSLQDMTLHPTFSVSDSSDMPLAMHPYIGLLHIFNASKVAVRFMRRPSATSYTFNLLYFRMEVNMLE
jgi:hypothetical protein